MSQVFIIVKRDIREAFHNKSTYLYIVLLLFIAIPLFQSFNSAINGLAEQSLSAADLRLACQSTLNAVASTLPLVFSMLLCSIIATYSITMDKAKRILETLMATPLSLRQIWLGKSLAVTLPGIAIALSVSLLVFLAMNIISIVPLTGGFIPPSILAAVTGLIIIPALVFCIVSLVSFLQLVIANARLANLAFTGFFLAIYFLTISQMTWDFSLIYLVALALLAIVASLLSRFLDKERVVLSSKG